MFGQVMKNSALSAKVQAMLGKALKDSDYNIMMNMKSVPAVAEYLMENTTYAKAFEGVSSVYTLHRTRLEELLHQDLYRDAKRLTTYMNGSTKKFMEFISLEDSVLKLKLALRFMLSGNVPPAVDCLHKISALEGIKTDILLETRSVDEFIKLLRDTAYYTPLKVFAGRKEQQTPFHMEMALDTYWAKMVFKYAKKYLSPEEAKGVLKVYGTEFDLENLTFLLRCKRSFRMTEEEMYASVIPVYYRVTEKTIADIVKCQGYKEAVEIISAETIYGKAFSAEDRFIEKRQKEYMRNLLHHSYNVNRYSVQAPIYYVHMRMTEINNIVSIIEGIRYGLEADRIAEYLILKGKGGRENDF